MALTFFNIGKANARIAELETQLAAASENSAAVEKRAEQLQSDLQAAQVGIAPEKARADKAEAEAKVVKEKADKLETDLKAAQDAVKDFDAKVSTEAEKIGSKKALEITASLGTTPVKAPAKEQTAEEKPKLFGLAKVQAAFAAQSQK